MSGLEVAGVVLGAIPLIVRAIEDYEKIVDLILVYRKYSKVVGKFNTELAVQRVIFQNECVLLLSHVVDDPQALHDMFHQPSHGLRVALCYDESLERKLSERVNERVQDSYQQIMSLLQLIVQILEQIYEETKDSRTDLGGDVSKPSVWHSLYPMLHTSTIAKPGHLQKDSVHFKDWAHNVRRKFRFIFGKSSLKVKIDELYRCNESFRALSQQVSQFKGFHNPQYVSESVDKDLDDIRRTRKASESLCCALATLWSCPDHPEHSANLRLGSEDGEIRSEASPKVCFNVAVTSWAVERYKESEKPVELTIESILNEESNPSAKDIRNPEGAGYQLVEALQASGGKFPAYGKGALGPVKKGGKTVGFADEVRGATVRVAQGQEKALLVDLCSGYDLCQRFRSHPAPELTHTAACMGYLQADSKCKHLVYRHHPTNSSFSGATSLSHLLTQGQFGQNLNKLDKWRLAGTLTMAVLQYHSTPWLQATWMSNSISFFNTGGGGHMKSLKSPHLHLLRRSRDKGRETQPEPHDPWIKNETLFRLGIILLELEFEDSIERIIQNHQLRDTPNQPQGSLAHQLVLPKQRAGGEMGTDYGRIVRMCLDCDFGLGLHEYSLKDKLLQRAFYLHVVCQFQKLLPSWEKIYGLGI